MSDLIPRDRLQPALLDRLTDEEPDSKVESRDRRVISMPRLRECVLRDLTWLLNCSPLSQSEDLLDFPAAAESVIDFGIHDLAGVALSSVDPADLERSIRTAIALYEPRILRKSLKVRAITPEDPQHHNSLWFEIEGELWGQPLPTHLYLKSEVDLEDGSMIVVDRANTGPV